MKIILFSALPHEYEAFRKLTGGQWRLRCAKPFRTFDGSVFQKDLTLIETGMGKRMLREAFRWGIEGGRPDLVVSMGFAGSLWPGFDVGSVLLGNRFSCRASGLERAAELDGTAELARTAVPEPLPVPVSRPEPGAVPGSRPAMVPESSLDEDLILDIGPGLAGLCRHNGIATARFVTTERLEHKRVLRTVFGDGPSCVDMESYFLCRYSREEKVPFLGLRSISDGVDDEIDFDLSDISDEAGRVNAVKAMAAVIRRPSLLRSFFHLWRGSRTAAESLANALLGLLSLPETELREILLECGIRCPGVQEPHAP